MEALAKLAVAPGTITIIASPRPPSPEPNGAGGWDGQPSRESSMRAWDWRPVIYVLLLWLVIIHGTASADYSEVVLIGGAMLLTVEMWAALMACLGMDKAPPFERLDDTENAKLRTNDMPAARPLPPPPSGNTREVEPPHNVAAFLVAKACQATKKQGATAWDWCSVSCFVLLGLIFVSMQLVCLSAAAISSTASSCTVNTDCPSGKYCEARSVVDGGSNTCVDCYYAPLMLKWDELGHNQYADIKATCEEGHRNVMEGDMGAWLAEVTPARIMPCPPLGAFVSTQDHTVTYWSMHHPDRVVPFVIGAIAAANLHAHVETDRPA